MKDGYDTNRAKRDSDGGYVQALYSLPTKTKVGISWGESFLDLASGEAASTNKLVNVNEMTTIGAYHPLTKHLNLVAEYSNIKSDSHAVGNPQNRSNVGSLGAILFF